MWWNPKLDILMFHDDWLPRWHTWALCGLQGLEHVKHVAISWKHAHSLCYDTAQFDDGSWLPARGNRDPLIIKFCFRHSPTLPNVIPVFFDHFEKLSVHFGCLYGCHLTPSKPWNFPDWTKHWDDVAPEACCTVTFRMGSDIKTAVRQLVKFRLLCMRTMGERLDDHIQEEQDELGDEPLIDSKPYAVKDKIDADQLMADDVVWWNGVCFDMCQANDFECL